MPSRPTPTRQASRSGIVCPPQARLPVLAIAGSLLLLLGGWVLPALFTDTSRWVPVPGRIVEATWSGASLKAKLRLRYSYEAGGKTFHGRRFSLWTDSIPRGALNPELRQALQPGAAVQVYHHPTSPERAVLDPHVPTAHKAGALFGTALCALGVAAALFGRAPD